MGNIMIFCAHSDDEAVGMGGTIAKLSEQGNKIIKVVFSSGEKSLPHIQEDVMIKMREVETNEASRFIGISRTISFGIPDTKVKQIAKEKGMEDKVKKLVDNIKPAKVYVPPEMDPHPDHRAVNKIVVRAVKSLRKKYSIYEYEVWNVTNEHKPMVYEDITQYYKKKVKYMKMFKSQWVYMYALWLPVYFRSRNYGGRHDCKFAERFYRIQ